jgi:ABC-type transporter Mla MlaB component
VSKESGGFFRKVAKFVANPTTDWAELDRARTSPGESEFAKSEIKAMIERKRRNDFVRKRELDMLRKIRREGLTPDAALALGSPSNLDPESSPHAGARSDMAVKAKIDAIEQQMVGVVTRQPVETPAARPSVQPIRLHDMPSPPDAITSPATLPYEDTAPEISQAVLDAARGALPGASGARPASVPTLQAALDVIEVMHDPELDEAVIAFANADFDQCERGLMALVQPGAARHDHLDTWMVLFDLYRALDLPQKFEQLAVAFLQKFGVSPPQWYSLPDKVSRFLGQGERPPALSGAAQPEAVPADDVVTREGWLAPAVLDTDAMAALRIACLQLPRPWTMSWDHVQDIRPEGAAMLAQTMNQWANDGQPLVWHGIEVLLDRLAELSPTGSRDADPAFWMLKLAILRLTNRPELFDEVAIDYCVTYELSPPSWEPARGQVLTTADTVSPPTRPLSHVSEVTTSFVESQMHDDVEFVQVATLNLSGQLLGDIGDTLAKLDDQLGASVTLEIDCQHLLRVDFIAAGDLLNWVLARRSEGREVHFMQPHRLVALFFGAMGINEHARVKLQHV